MTYRQQLAELVEHLTEAHEEAKQYIEDHVMDKTAVKSPYLIQDTSGHFILLDSLSALTQATAVLASFER